MSEVYKNKSDAFLTHILNETVNDSPVATKPTKFKYSDIKPVDEWVMFEAKKAIERKGYTPKCKHCSIELDTYPFNVIESYEGYECNPCYIRIINSKRVNQWSQ